MKKKIPLMRRLTGEYRWEKWALAVAGLIFIFRGRSVFLSLDEIPDSDAVIIGMIFLVLFYLSEMRWRFFRDSRADE